MNFKEWFVLENMSQEETLKNLISEFAAQENLPEPTDYLDSGDEAYVFNTTNPDLIARITKEEFLEGCETIIEKPSIQAMGGVVKVVANGMFKKHFISYKEKVDTFWERKLDPQNKQEILNNLHNLVFDYYDHDHDKLKERIKTLSKFKQTKKLAITLSRMPMLVKDIHDGNVGINKENDLVLIDC